MFIAVLVRVIFMEDYMVKTILPVLLPVIFLLLLPFSVDAVSQGVSVKAVKGVNVFFPDGTWLKDAFIIVEGCKIKAVGSMKDWNPKQEIFHKEFNLKGRWVYPAFIDAFYRVKDNKGPRKKALKKRDAPYSERSYYMTRRASTETDWLEPERKNLLKGGFAYVHAVPAGGIVSGTTAVFSTASDNPGQAVLVPEKFMALFLHPHPMDYVSYLTKYPSTYGALAADLKQLKIDTLHHRQIKKFGFAHPTGRHTYKPGLDKMLPYFTKQKTLLLAVDDLVEQRIAGKLCKEMDIRPVFVVHPDVWRRPRDLGGTDSPIILPLHFKPPAISKYARFGPDYKKEAMTRVYPRELARFVGQCPNLSLTAPKPGDYPALFKNIRALMEHGLTEAQAVKALTANPARLLGMSKYAGAIKPGMMAGFFITGKKVFDPGSKILMTVADGNVFDYRGDDKNKKKKDKKAAKKAKKMGKSKKKALPANVTGMIAQKSPDLLLKNATVYTFDKGVLKNTDILVLDGKIARIGTNLREPSGKAERPGFRVIDLTGKFVIPGIIDAHSHIALGGGLNELGDYITPEVDVRYNINPDDPGIYYGLSGGVTMAHDMFGSANPIGGENFVIKLKWGATPEEMIETRAPRTVKFALGENPRAPVTQYPSTRMGVTAAIDTAFAKALDYRKKWKRYKEEKAKTRDGSPTRFLPPKRDLRMEALLDIIDRKMAVRCHSYRADETLQLIRLSKKYGFKIAAFEHIQQAYRIAGELKAEGIGLAVFMDFWNYKLEASEYTPYGLRILYEKGVLLCAKSDFVPRMRHLHYKAGLMRRFAGMNDLEALKTVTLNPAKLLGMDAYTGSIETGKDADLAVFAGNPLNSGSRCVMTIVEGRVRFDIDHAPYINPALNLPKKKTGQRRMARGGGSHE